jgi:WD40 repeat protein
VAYNGWKDSMVLSAGSCGIVNLWNMSSIAFQNISGDVESIPASADHHVRSYVDHEDGITGLAWSAGGNQFLFATLSYDGRVIINKVPDNEVKALLSM